MVTQKEKQHLIKLEKGAIKAYKKVGLKRLASGEREDLAEVRKLKVNPIHRRTK